MTPERIYDWMDSHLCIARFYGYIDIDGWRYEIDTADPKQPLVRADVLARERRAMSDAERASAAKAKAEFEARGLL